MISGKKIQNKNFFMHFCCIKGHILGQKSSKIEKNLRNLKLYKISSKGIFKDNIRKKIQKKKNHAFLLYNRSYFRSEISKIP